MLVGAAAIGVEANVGPHLLAGRNRLVIEAHSFAVIAVHERLASQIDQGERTYARAGSGDSRAGPVIDLTPRIRATLRRISRLRRGSARQDDGGEQYGCELHDVSPQQRQRLAGGNQPASREPGTVKRARPPADSTPEGLSVLMETRRLPASSVHSFSI